MDLNPMDMSHIEWRKASYSTNNGGSCVEVGMTPVEWRKASYSSNNGGNCVEVGVWRRASHSSPTGGNCVEVSAEAPMIAVRDSKDPDGPKLAFGRAGWTAFTDQLKAGRFTA
jgi:hypothetical protein